MACSLHNSMLPFFLLQASKVNRSSTVNKPGTLLGINGFALRPGAIQSLVTTCSSHTFKKWTTKEVFLLVQQHFSNSTHLPTSQNQLLSHWWAHLIFTGKLPSLDGGF